MHNALFLPRYIRPLFHLAFYLSRIELLVKLTELTHSATMKHVRYFLPVALSVGLLYHTFEGTLGES